jgi:AAA domain
VTGRALLGVVLPDSVLKVWLWNLEDPQIETTRKIQAACIQHNIKREEIEGQLFVNSGRDQPLVIAKTLRAGVTIMQPVVDDLVKQIKELGIDVLMIDPFVSCHEVEENDNSGIDQVAKQWSRVAELGNCAVHLLHHTRKAPTGTEVTTESGRGAKALSDAVRIARALNIMTEDEGKTAGVDNARFFFRAFNDKANLAPPKAQSDWFRLASVPLGNGVFGTNGDDMGVVVKWVWPDHTADVTGGDFDKVAAVIRSGKWRSSPQAAQWVGHAVARAMRLDIAEKHDKAKVNGLVKYWLGTKALIEVQADDDNRIKRTFIEVRPDE